MIYYIIQIDPDTHDEVVISTHDNADKAAVVLRGYRADAVVQTTSWLYRIDTVPSNEEIREQNKRIPGDPNKLVAGRRAGKNAHIAELKMKMNDAYGKAKMDHEEQHYAYRDTDSMRTKDFTLFELFPVLADGFTGDFCTECGCEVKGRNQRTHAAWHNKLLP